MATRLALGLAFSGTRTTHTALPAKGRPETPRYGSIVTPRPRQEGSLPGTLEAVRTVTARQGPVPTTPRKGLQISEARDESTVFRVRHKAVSAEAVRQGTRPTICPPRASDMFPCARTHISDIATKVPRDLPLHVQLVTAQ